MNYIFCWGGGGGGAGDQKNKYVWRYDVIMIYFLYVFFFGGGSFLSRISSDKASNLPKRDVRFILLKWQLEKLGTLNKYI